MSFRYTPEVVQQYVKIAKRRINIIRTNNIGTRDAHLQLIIEDLLELNTFLVNRLACVADNVYLPDGVEER